ncbi:MAG: type IV pilus biogenesis/stability protein PilW, partial [Methylococcaceae bacterium]|nr:type IV pilus biogenesis/stability protein PilW [Methylococcaceae bacterium]
MIALAAMGLAACSNNPAKDPNERSAAELYRMKGIQYMENGQLNVALQDLKHSVELDDSSSEGHNA